MIDYISSFLQEFDYTSTERVSIAIAYEKVMESKEARERLLRLIDGYAKDMSYITEAHHSEIEAISTLSGVHMHTVELLTLICLSKTLRTRLAGLGMTKKNIFLTLSDIKYKMAENETTVGIVGTDKWSWYAKLLLPNVFAIGRLQFELAAHNGENYEKDGKILKKGSPVLRVHIPMSGEPLDSSACASSYREAKKFFIRLLGITDIPFTCSSWLLSPLNLDYLGEKSNIVKFASRYDITDVVEFKNDGAVFPWIFASAPNTPIEKLPRDTTLRRAYGKLLDDGGHILSASGIFFLEDPKPKKSASPTPSAKQKAEPDPNA